MLKEDYDINIVGKQVYEDDAGEITLNTTGTYTQRGGARFIAYKEYDAENPKVSYTSVLKVEPGKVTMMRSGSATRLILEEGRRHCVCTTRATAPSAWGCSPASCGKTSGRRGACWASATPWTSTPTSPAATRSPWK